MYKKGMDGVELINQRAEGWDFDRKPTIRFYLLFFFELIDVACVNSCIVSDMMDQDDLRLLEFKTIVSTYFIGRYISRSKARIDGKAGSKRNYQYQFVQANLQPHLQKFQNSKRLCEYYYIIHLKTCVKCTECGIFLRLMKERNCFEKHHS